MIYVQISAYKYQNAPLCEFQSNGAPVPEERCAHSNANGVAVPFQTA